MGDGASAGDPTLDPADEADRRRQLTSMKRTATGLLVGCGAVLLAAGLLEARWSWLGFVRATAEAALIGGIADWFAVTALFRHPLGVPIPHTAIIPMRRQRIARGLGRFVGRHLVSPEQIARWVTQMRPGEALARWLAVPENAARVAARMRAEAPVAARLIADEEAVGLIERGLRRGLGSFDLTSLVAGLIGEARRDGLHRVVAGEALVQGLRVASANEGLLRQRLREESPWWMPGALDDRLHDKLVGALERTLAESAADKDHPLRRSLEAAFERFLSRLETSGAAALAERLRAQALADAKTLPAAAAALWRRLRDALEKASAPPDDDPLAAILSRIGEQALVDVASLERLDRWIAESSAQAFVTHRAEVAALVESTVAGWVPEETADRIELYIGRDLQFIRINGMVVGGLVGLLLFSVERWL